MSTSQMERMNMNIDMGGSEFLEPEMSELFPLRTLPICKPIPSQSLMVLRAKTKDFYSSQKVSTDMLWEHLMQHDTSRKTGCSRG